AETSELRASFSSGDQRVVLIELYTSEGCSSCPPADRWLSKLKDDPRLWKDFSPIALHVDYWDYIGWRDRFARSEYSDRQRQYAVEGGVRAVYTPGMFRDGKEWRDWRFDGPPQSEEPGAGNLAVHVSDQDIAVQFTPDHDTDADLIAHVALLGMNLETRVREGENRGRILRHDFVALGVASTPLETVADGYRAMMNLPDVSAFSPDLALVVWVSRGGKQAPIQSVGGYLPQL
ncbi:MAG: DUF1223 domain-containing protein, partial [Gammaproteobacteria bacterium]|nr:DUF1223 domain-containing protein [Gammaproteobacteria bacterium]